MAPQWGLTRGSKMSRLRSDVHSDTVNQYVDALDVFGQHRVRAEVEVVRGRRGRPGLSDRVELCVGAIAQEDGELAAITIRVHTGEGHVGDLEVAGHVLGGPRNVDRVCRLAGSNVLTRSTQVIRRQDAEACR